MRSRYLSALALLTLLLPSGLVLFRWIPPETSVRGQVTDGHRPVAGARVRFQGRPEVVLTDANGRFVLPRPAGDPGRVTAAKEGFLIAGQSASARLALRLARWPAVDHDDYAWVDPAPDPARSQNCANCHGEIFREWSASGHARSAVNAKLLNLYDGTDRHGRLDRGWNLLADNPAGAGVCNACHAPTASFTDDLRGLSGVASRGIHCDYCHKIVDAPLDQLGLSHGRYGLKLLRPAQGQFFAGPLDDVDRGEDAFSPLYRESRYCAACHEGIVFGVPVYTTYSEWLASPARRQGKQCQTCHMAPSGRLTNVAPGHGGLPRDPHTLAGHRWPGGQAETLRRVLRTSVRLERSGPESRVVVEVGAESVGHRVPTGFVDRHLVLVLEAFDAAGKIVPLQDGPILPAAAGKLAGLPGKLYAKHLTDSEGRSPVPFWRADPAVTDTRLVPGQPDQTPWTFGPEAAEVRVRLLYRRFWEETARAKDWPDNEILIVDERERWRD